MKKGLWGFFLVAIVLMGLSTTAPYMAWAEKPILLGVPTSLGFLEGKEGLAAVQMAVDEINAAGGVKVGDKKHPFKVVSLDTR
ncbi:MAG: ethanolamine utilization protein EutJ, partial [Desulfatiglandales bacterium]